MAPDGNEVALPWKPKLTINRGSAPTMVTVFQAPLNDSINGIDVNLNKPGPTPRRNEGDVIRGSGRGANGRRACVKPDKLRWVSAMARQLAVSARGLLSKLGNSRVFS